MMCVEHFMPLVEDLRQYNEYESLYMQRIITHLTKKNATILYLIIQNFRVIFCHVKFKGITNAKY